ncbi:dihydrofolate reductase family protein [Homoserinimonas sp. A447]
MGKLIYSMITSLDGYVSGPDGSFDWGGADEELHDFVTERMASVGTYLNGRRLYELMVYWETAHLEPDQPRYVVDFALAWQAADKVVYSTTLSEVSSKRTRIERTFDADAVRKLKAESDLDLTIDGPTLAAQAIRAGLVDEYQVYVSPVIAGGGKRFFPDDVSANLELLDDHRLGSGLVYLRYGVTSAPAPTA